MSNQLPADVKKKALEICANYPYLTVQDPGTVLTATDGRKLVFVLDDEHRGLWLEVAPPPPGAGKPVRGVPGGLNSRVASNQP
jgi:hypothetical protein